MFGRPTVHFVSVAQLSLNLDQVRGHGVTDFTAYHISKLVIELLFEPVDVLLNELCVVFVDQRHFRIRTFLVFPGRRN